MGSRRSRDQANRWEGRPFAAFAVRAVVFTLPILAAIAASLWMSRVLPQPDTITDLLSWWAVVIGVSTTVLFGTDRLARKFLPLAALLQLTMIFPDEAPRRFRTALRSGSSLKHLQRQAAGDGSGSDDRSRAAAHILELAGALNTHDRQTRGHSERVRVYTELLGEEMGLSEEDRGKLRWAALLHDIGKLKIPDEVLNKKGPLDADEWTQIKLHPGFGAEICAPLLEWLGPWADTIIDHHERWDGAGYPAGKKTEEISLGGRMVSVGDAYDVMTTVRTYKAPMSGAVAREELARHAGLQFDPDVVRAFLSIAMGRLRWVAGPLSWLAGLPGLRFAGAAQQVGNAVAVAAVATAGVVAAIGGGIIDLPGQVAAVLGPETIGPLAAPGLGPGPTPRASDDAYTVPAGAAVELDVLSNDLARGAALSIVVDPAFGTVSLNDDGTVTYTPAGGFSGSDAFSYQLGDQPAGFAEVLIEVKLDHEPPEAENDAVTVAEDSPLAIDVLANDASTLGFDPASMVIVGGPGHGTAVVDPVTGSIEYVPAPDFAGQDEFVYEIADLGGLKTEGVVAIAVEPVNDPPDVEDDTVTVAAGGSVLIDVLANDTDPDGSIVAAGLSVPVDAVSGSAAPAAGAVFYVSGATAPTTDRFTYEACDSFGACGRGTVRVSVVGTAPPAPGGGGGDDEEAGDGSSGGDTGGGDTGGGDTGGTGGGDTGGGDTGGGGSGGDEGSGGGGTGGGVPDTGPQLPGPGPQVTAEDEPLLIDLLAGATDPAGITVSVPATSGLGAAIEDLGDGTVRYTPPQDTSGADSFVFTATADGLNEDVAVAITITPVNDAPVVPGPGLITIPEDTVATFDPLEGATDVDADDLSLDSFDATSQAGGTITEGSLVYTPPVDFFGDDSFAYTVADGGGALVTVEVSVSVTAVNDAPEPVADEYSIEAGSLLTVDVPGLLDNDLDPDGDTLTSSLQADAASGEVVVAGDGSFTYLPDAGFSGEDTFTYEASDGLDAATAVVTITVAPSDENQAPVLEPVGDTAGDEAALVEFTAVATDPDADAMAFSLDGAPGGAVIDPVSGVFGWTPGEGDGPGVFTFEVVVTDDGVPALADSETITITVGEVNQAPGADDPGDQTATESEAVALSLTVSDPDVPANQLGFAATGLPPGLTIDGASGSISGVVAPGAAAGSPYAVVVTVTDDGVPPLSTDLAFTWTVEELNLPPVLDPIGDRSVPEGVEATFTAAASDPNAGDGLAFSVVGAPGGAVIDPVSGVFGWTPGEGDGPGVFTFEVVVTDDGVPALADSETITITVGEVNTAPTLDPVGDQVGVEGSEVGFTAAASDGDVPVQGLRFSVVGAPGGAVIDPVSGVFGWTPGEGDGPGVFTFEVVVTDDGVPALADSETITITVGEVNTAPTLDPVGDQVGVEGSEVGFTAAASDGDVPVQGLRFSVVGAPGGAVIDPVSGVFGWTPGEGDGPGVFTFEVVVTDDGVPALADSETITITVGEVNTAPTLDPVGDQVGVEGSEVGFTAAASDGDVPVQGLRFSVVGAPGGAVIDPVSGVFGWTPGEGDGPGVFLVTVVVTDDGVPALADSETITITVGEVNTAPTLDPVGDQVGVEGSEVGFTAAASDGDVPVQGLRFSVVGAPGGAVIDPVSGVFGWTPGEGDGPGVFLVTVVVTDDGVPPLSDSESIAITVGEVNTAPTLDPIGDHDVIDETLLTFTAAAGDTDLPAQTLTFSLSGAPAGAAIDPATGVFTWTPTDAQGPGTYTFDVAVTDNGVPALADTETITITVTEFADVWYLHWDGSTADQLRWMPLTTEAPTATTLVPYDTRSGGQTGLFLDPGSYPGDMYNEEKAQSWVVSDGGGLTSISRIDVTAWAAMKVGAGGTNGQLRAVLTVCRPNPPSPPHGSCNDIGTGLGPVVALPDDAFVATTITIDLGASYTIGLNDLLALTILPDAGNTGDSIRLGFDTVDYPARVHVTP